MLVSGCRGDGSSPQGIRYRVEAIPEANGRCRSGVTGGGSSGVRDVGVWDLGEVDWFYTVLGKVK